MKEGPSVNFLQNLTILVAIKDIQDIEGSEAKAEPIMTLPFKKIDIFSKENYFFILLFYRATEKFWINVLSLLNLNNSFHVRRQPVEHTKVRE
jgi:hypothetical protein